MNQSSTADLPRIAVINVVGLCRRLIGSDTPFLKQMLERPDYQSTAIEPCLPAVTSTMQATYLTGKAPGDHGIVGNYWYDRDYAEHRGWKQSNHLVQGDKLWEVIRRDHPDYTCAKVFWWNNMYSSVDYSITPRPIYCSDGKKVFDIQTWPMDIRPQIKADLGDFPFPSFWGPAAGLPSSAWIAESAKWYEQQYSPHLSLIYLPHLDYNLQRHGTDPQDIAGDLSEIDSIVADLVGYLENRGVQPVILSEYGITPVHRPIHINRVFREKGWLSYRDELGREQIDIGACQVFAIADHQLAHVYLNDPSIRAEVVACLEQMDGVSTVLTGTAIAGAGLDHERSGDIVVLAEEDSWFTYYYWLDDDKAPDYARCVDIHRKPGYDPAELFLDPAIPLPKLKIVKRLLQKKLGFRMLMDVVPVDATLVKGSHGIIPHSELDYPIYIGPSTPSGSAAQSDSALAATEVFRKLHDLATSQK